MSVLTQSLSSVTGLMSFPHRAVHCLETRNIGTKYSANPLSHCPRSASIETQLAILKYSELHGFDNLSRSKVRIITFLHSITPNCTGNDSDGKIHSRLANKRGATPQTCQLKINAT